MSAASVRQNIGIYVLVKSIKIKANQTNKYANKVANVLFTGLERSGCFKKITQQADTNILSEL